MLKRVIHSACIWAVALCVLVQSAGAAGGVLCVGCTNLWGGVAVASAPCTPVNDCCASHREQSEPGTGRQDDGCGCFDITLSPTAGTLARPPVKIVLALVHFIVPAPAIAVVQDAPALRPMWGARAGPKNPGLLLPSARQTVLLI